jgi:hypothetical protein
MAGSGALSACAGAVRAANVPQARAGGSARGTGWGGGRILSNAMSGINAGGWDGCRWAEASKTCWQCPQRTHPSEMRNWSATTLNIVAQDGQRVIWLMGCAL